MKTHLVFFVGLSFYLLAPVSDLVAKTPTQVAPSVVNSDQSGVQKQINQLRAEIQRLQAQLAVREVVKVSVAVPVKPHTLNQFSFPFETIYFVTEGKLVTVAGSKPVRSVDAALFSLFTKLVGEKVVKEYIREWRVFYETKNDLGAFVEVVPKEGSWVFGVNRADFAATDLRSLRSYAELYMHEYAHILLYSEKDFVATYQKRFWTTKDAKQAVRIKKLTGEARFESALAYFEDNASRFVTDYATVAADEDMAETFVSFVLLPTKPTTSDVKSQKIRAFYDRPALVSVRSELRTNLVTLGLLTE